MVMDWINEIAEQEDDKCTTERFLCLLGRYSLSPSDLSDLLRHCDKEQLIEVLVEEAKKDSNFNMDLCIRFSDYDDADSIVFAFKETTNVFFQFYYGYDFYRAVKVGQFLIGKTEELASDVEKVIAYLRLILIIKCDWWTYFGYKNDDIEELYAVMDFYSCNMEKAVKRIVQSQNMHDVKTVWKYLMKAWKRLRSCDSDACIYRSLFQLCAIPEYRKIIDDALDTFSVCEEDEIDDRHSSILFAFGTEEEKEDYIRARSKNTNGIWI
jgi:hypothetical protein